MSCCHVDMRLIQWGQMTTLTTNDPNTKKYRSYLVRLWRVETPGQSWRASLEDPRTGQRIGFASLEQLFAFLMEQVDRDTEGVTME